MLFVAQKQCFCYIIRDIIVTSPRYKFNSGVNVMIVLAGSIFEIEIIFKSLIWYHLGAFYTTK